MYSNYGKVTAFILLTVEIGREHEVVDKLKDLNDSVEARVVYGEYDVVIRVETDSLKSLERIVSKVRRTPGVLRTVTLVSTS